MRPTLLALLFILLGSVYIPSTTFAATLSVVPTTGQVTAGNIITVRVLVDSTDQAINVAEGTILFPPDFLQVLSLDTNNSLFPFWIQAPTFSNPKGEITFNGGVPSPGFTGAKGTIVAITFQAKKSGAVTIALSNASVLANDGLGTNVLQGTNNSTLTIEKAPPAAPKTSSNPTISTTMQSPIIIASTTSPIMVTTTGTTTSVLVIPVPLSSTTISASLHASLFNNTTFLVIGAILFLLFVQLGIILFVARRLHLFHKSLESGVLKSERDLQKGFSLLKEDLEQHLKELGHTRDVQERAVKEGELRTEVEDDIADLERFARRDLEDLRTPSEKREVKNLPL